MIQSSATQVKQRVSRSTAARQTDRDRDPAAGKIIGWQEPRTDAAGLDNAQADGKPKADDCKRQRCEDNGDGRDLWSIRGRIGGSSCCTSNSILTVLPAGISQQTGM